MVVKTKSELSDLIFYKTGAMSFHEQEIPPKSMREILGAATSCAWLGRWRLLSVTEKDLRVKVVEVWQEALRAKGLSRDAQFIERWKKAPLFIAFYLPRDFQPFTWVPSEFARIFAIQEVGTAVRSIELKALEHGIGLHGIMGMLIPEINRDVEKVLGIPEGQELVYFGIMGYPDEQVEVKFPNLEDVCYPEKWVGADS